MLFYMSGKAGARFRIRSAYVYRASGDTLNSTAWTSYQYFTFAK